jgi:thiamine-phosphate pyrophosphorylase
LFPALYAILDAPNPESMESTLALAGKLVDGGVRLFQLRAKRATSRQLCEMSRSFRQWLESRPDRNSNPVKFIVNDRPDIAALSGASGVHVGQEDLPPEESRKVCAPPLWVGVSTHNLEQLRAADRTSADYIAIGPIFATASKENPDPVVGLEMIRGARKLTRKPLVAIGGITVQSAGDVFRAGADSVAVIGDLSRASDPARRAQEYLKIARSISR